MTRAPLDRDAVLSAAAELADRDGFDSISVSALARHLGVQPASLYSHVRDRAAVLDGVHTLALAELAELIAVETAGRSGRDALAGLAEAHRSYAGEHPGRWAALHSRAAPETARSDAAARVVSLLWAVLRAYDLAEAELVHATRFVGGTIDGFLALERAGAYAHRDEASDHSWQRVVDAMDRALASWPTDDEVPA
jgi:AcrR family transcriptional regulator